MNGQVAWEEVADISIESKIYIVGSNELNQKDLKIIVWINKK